MKSITLISIFILLSFSHSSTVSDINLSSLVTLFLPDINNALKQPISAGTSFGPLSASVNVYFDKINQKNIYIAVESNQIHLKVSNFIARPYAELKLFRWVSIFKKIPIIGKILAKVIKKFTTLNTNGIVKATIDLKFKLVPRSSSIIGVEITYFRTNTDLSFMFGDAKVSPFSGIISPIKKEVEKKILDVFARNKLQKAIDSSIDKLAYKLLKKIG